MVVSCVDMLLLCLIFISCCLVMSDCSLTFCNVVFYGIAVIGETCGEFPGSILLYIIVAESN